MEDIKKPSSTHQKSIGPPLMTLGLPVRDATSRRSSSVRASVIFYHYLDMAAGKESYPSSIPININDLLNVQGVESQRIEFKKAWHNNSKIKGGPYWQIIHTITAFANDYYNVNGGYVIIGVEEKEDWDSSDNRQIILPPCGVQGNLEQIQKEITGACRGNIQPPYVPILQPEVVAERKHVLVIWVRPSDERPHMCRASDKGEYKYYFREATQTKIAQAQEVTRLCQYNSTPFDDRTAIESGKIKSSMKN